MLFQYGDFKSAAGLPLAWKIECEALTPDDWACIAKVGAANLEPFGSVIGVPSGGWELAHALRPYVNPSSTTTLFVDDVWTTGTSMYNYVNRINELMGKDGYAFNDDWKGFVAFARGSYPVDRVMAFLRLGIIKEWSY